MPTIEMLILTNGNSDAVIALDSMPDQFLTDRIRAEAMPWANLSPNAWHSDDPEYDLVVQEVRATLRADLNVAFYGSADTRVLDPMYELQWMTIPTNEGPVTTVVCTYPDDLDEYDDMDYDAMTVATPVARLRAVHPVCGSHLMLPTRDAPARRAPVYRQQTPRFTQQTNATFTASETYSMPIESTVISFEDLATLTVPRNLRRPITVDEALTGLVRATRTSVEDPDGVF